ncbi:MAG: S41 family peptidase [Phycisphaerales bacterium]|nr:S41 family peptidase [Phycisphaerales bacterium]
MKTFSAKAASTMILVSGAIAFGAQTQSSLDTESTIHAIAQTIKEKYVYPDTGDQIAQMLLENLSLGNYDDMNKQALAQSLREDLVDLSHDLHFGVRVLPDGWEPPSREDDNEDELLRNGPQAPYGFNSVQRLSGNIGYIELLGFNQASYVHDTVEAAMQLLQGSQSIIFDLRSNGGGDPETVQLISSYLFDSSTPTHLNSLYSRPNDTTTEYWTHDQINTDLVMKDVPVYVLTSGRTFSAAEEFSYNLKNLKRATLIGETTGGGAHPVESHIIDNQLMIVIPTARAISPITGTNWEGTGVSPHIESVAADALNIAIEKSLQASLQSGDMSARWGLATLKSENDPIVLSSKQRTEFVGSYGQREIRATDHGLEYRRKGVSDWNPILCIEKDQFVIDGFKGFIMEFTRDKAGNIDGVNGLYQQGHTDRSSRDE